MSVKRLLTVDVGNESIKICEASKSKQQITIYYAIEVPLQDGSVIDGTILNEEGLAEQIREVLHENNIKNKNVIFTVNSSKIATKEVVIPMIKEKLLRQTVQSNASEYFPVQLDSYVVGYSVIEQVNTEENKSLRLQVLAAPKDMILGYFKLAEFLGWKVLSVDYMGNSALQLIKTQIEEVPSLVIQIGAESTVVTIMRGPLMLFQRTVPYGRSIVESTVMEVKQVSEKEAGELLRTGILHDNFDDEDQITESLRYLMTNIQRIMDFYISRHKDVKIEKVYVLGEGSNIKGFRELCSAQIRIPLENMSRIREFKGVVVKGNQNLDGILLHGYMNNIGAIIAPVGFMPGQIEEQEKRAGQGQSKRVLFAVGMLAAVALTAFPYMNYMTVKSALDDINGEIERIKDIQVVEEEYAAAEAKYNDLQQFLAYQSSPNSRLCEVILQLEERTPAQITFSSFQSNAGGVALAGTSKSKDAVAELIKQLKEQEGLTNVYVGSLSEAQEVDGTVNVTFSISFTILTEEKEGAADEVQS